MDPFEIESQLTLLNLATVLCELAAHWFIQSTLLITIGLIVSRLLRSRGSAVQSLVYRTTLAAALVCPLVTWGMSAVGFSGYSIVLPDDWAYQLKEQPLANIESSHVAEFATGKVSTNTAANSDTMDRAVDVTNEVPSNQVGSIGSQSHVHQAAAVQAIVDSAAMAPDSNPVSALSIQRFGVVAIGAVVIWLLVASIMLVRLCIAWWQLVNLRRGAVQVETEIADECRELSRLMKVTAPQVCRSPYLPSPCLAGLQKPVILLPGDDVCLSMRNVLIHELAHLLRRDCHWNLLRHLATTCFFFQPLLWLLSRLIEATAEEVCDDHVVQFGGDRFEYAHRLVDIAELSTAPIAAAGVGIVSLRSMLEQRVSRLLNTSRTLSTRVGNLLLVSVLLFGLTITMIVGLVGLGAQSSPAEAAQTKPAAASPAGAIQTDTTQIETSLTANDEQDALHKISGTIVHKDGSPVSVTGRLYLEASIVTAAENLQAVTDQYSGRLHQILDNDDPVTVKISMWVGEFVDSYSIPIHEQTTEAILTYHADGFAPTRVGPLNILPDRSTDNVRIVLNEGFSSTIRVVNEEEEPIAGAELKVMPLIDGRNWVGTYQSPEVMTDENGEVLLKNLADTGYRFIISAHGYRSRRTEQPLKPMEKKTLTLIAAPQTTGVVRDPKGLPLANVKLFGWHEMLDFDIFYFHGAADSVGSGRLIATTDRDGKFLIDQLTRNATNMVVAEAPDGSRAVIRNLQAGESTKILLADRRDLRIEVIGDIRKLPLLDGKPFVTVRQSVAFQLNPKFTTSRLISGTAIVEPTATGGVAFFEGLATDDSHSGPQEVMVMFGRDFETAKQIDVNPNGETIVSLEVPVEEQATEKETDLEPAKKLIHRK